VLRNAINHCRVPPYYSSLNGLAESMVKTVKQALNKADKGDSIEAKISKFLASYRNTSYSVTGHSSGEGTTNMLVTGSSLYVSANVNCCKYCVQTWATSI